MTNNEIEWRPVVGYEGFYDVSCDGQVEGEMADKQEAIQAYVDAPAFWDSLTEQQQIQAAV